MFVKKTGIFIAPGRRPWKHELRVAEILALAGHYVEFLAEGNLPTADIKLDGIEFEIKSPERFNANTFEHIARCHQTVTAYHYRYLPHEESARPSDSEFSGEPGL